MSRDRAGFKEVISYIFALVGGVSFTLIAIILQNYKANFLIALIPIVLVSFSAIVYGFENGYFKGSLFSAFISLLWSGACFTLFVPFGFFTSTVAVAPSVYLLCIICGLTFIGLAYLCGKKFKSLNK